MVGEDPTILQGEATLVGLLPITAIQDQADPEADPEGPSSLKTYSDQLKMVRDSFFLFQLKFLSALESGFTTVRVGVYNCQELFTFLHHITRKKGGTEDKAWNNFHLWLDASEPVRQEEGGIFLELV